MEARGFWKLILAALLLNIILKTSESLPLHEARKAATERRPLHVNGDIDEVDIFDIILKANLKEDKFPHHEGMASGGIIVPDVTEGEDLFQGDIVMTNDIRTALKNSHTDIMRLHRREKDGQRRQRRAATAHVEQRWPIVNGQVEVPYVIEASSVPDQAVIIQAMDHWHAKVPCIAFVPRTNQADYLSFFAGKKCYSWVGRKGGQQRISVGSGCAVMGVVAHEIGHALGFWHEQSRPDRDSYVKILWTNILTDHLDDFKMIDTADTNDLGVGYDLASLMHYGPKAFSKSPSLSTIESLDGSTNFGQRNGLSDKDIEQARLLYCPRTKACKTLYTDLHQNCLIWGNMGQCDNKDYKVFMYTNCKKTCICKVCEDTAGSNCTVKVSAGYCTNAAYKDWMALNCKKSCGLCN